MQAWWDSNNTGDRPAKPDPAKFGIDFGEVRGKFADYLQHMERWAPLPVA